MPSNMDYLRTTGRILARVALAALTLLISSGRADTSLLPDAGLNANPVVEMKARPFELQQVRLLPGPFKDAMDREGQYLLSLDADRLLHTFRLNAGLPSDAEPLGGWEAPKIEVRGHFVGHYLSGCSLMFASTGDERFRQRAALLVGELAKCQQALDSSGYLSAYPESFFDRVETLRPVWAPYYTLHKIMAGLLDVHIHCENAQALAVVEGMARWCRKRCDQLSEEQMQQMLNRTEQGGMDEVLANLYGVTGKPEYLALSRRFVQRTYNDPLAASRDELKGQHVNSFVPNIIGTARQYELAGNQEDYQVAHFFWHQVTGHRCYATGGTSNREHWQSEPDQLATELGDHTQETCCTYNLLKLTRHLFAWEPRAEYADYYEKALLNSILSTQDPKTGMMMYFVTLGQGRWKYFNRPTDSFWCCTGTGVENHAKYGDSIYFQDHEGLFVNLFIPSELDWTEKRVRIRQETGYPDVSATRLQVIAEEPSELTLRIRIPGWATRGVVLRLNGEELAADAKPASYFSLRRVWHDGDTIELSMPMTLHTAPMPDDPTVAAFMFGPLVLAGMLGGEGLTDEMVYTSENWYVFPRNEIASVPPLVTEDEDLTRCLEPVAGQPATFRTVGLENNLTLVPYHRLFGERYAVYWRVFRKESPEHADFLAQQEARRQRLARLVDEVEIGDSQSESAHQLSSEHSAAGLHQGRSWRDASEGGHFSYQLAVDRDQPMWLGVTYWGSDSARRTFDILVDDHTLATVTLTASRPGEFFDVEYEIPPQLTRDKQQVTVKFQAHPGCMAGGVFGLGTLRR